MKLKTQVVIWTYLCIFFGVFFAGFAVLNMLFQQFGFVIEVSLLVSSICLLKWGLMPDKYKVRKERRGELE